MIQEPQPEGWVARLFFFAETFSRLHDDKHYRPFNIYHVESSSQWGESL